MNKSLKNFERSKLTLDSKKKKMYTQNYFSLWAIIIRWGLLTMLKIVVLNSNPLGCYKSVTNETNLDINAFNCLAKVWEAQLKLIQSGCQDLVYYKLVSRDTDYWYQLEEQRVLSMLRVSLKCLRNFLRVSKSPLILLKVTLEFQKASLECIYLCHFSHLKDYLTVS